MKEIHELSMTSKNADFKSQVPANLPTNLNRSLVIYFTTSRLRVAATRIAARGRASQQPKQHRRHGSTKAVTRQDNAVARLVCKEK